MSEANLWTPVRLKGERWLAVRLSIAPRQLPAFTVTWFDVRATGPLPEWALLLGAMGLHVYGEGSEIVVQDREGSTRQHDAFRLATLSRWIADETLQGLLALNRSVSGDGREHPETYRRRIVSEGKPADALAAEVRSALLAGHWDHPGGRGYPAVRSDTPLLRRDWQGNTTPQPPPSPGADRAVVAASRAASPEASWRDRIPWPGRASMALLFLPVTAAGVSVALSLPAWLGMTLFVGAWGVVIVRLYGALAVSILFPQEPAVVVHDDARRAFVQLHDAIRAEGTVSLNEAGNAGEAGRWEAYMAEILMRYRSLTEPPIRTEAP